MRAPAAPAYRRRRRHGWAGAWMLLLGACGAPDAERDAFRAAVASYDREAIVLAAERIEAFLRGEAPAAAEALQPGLTSAELDSTLGPLPCRLPEEVHRLYGWHAGARPGSAQPFVARHAFIAPSEAVAEYRERLRGARDRAWRWEEAWFPLFELYGEHYVTACTPGAVRAAPVRWVTPERPESPIAFTSLTTLLQTVAEWYESGAVGASGGEVTLDLERMREIHGRLNPGAVFPYGGV